ncbi:glutathione S-transferase family protein [Aestuariibacter sp. GS-14]|uniref:glutathione S-transferase family protein n=1 Tax=Aestuariibacter sp. GS-14 TaxID=2590670 RepID=UPI00112E3C83|nr:glutathione S-transferase family protein [Aestuariibacter sp. GS-14]TPV60036.1 glutathione S-transferase family protein [Aestuariibacter sp. GS-14]
MIMLVGFGPKFGLADASPFVLKVNVYMNMSGIAFTTVTDFAAFKKAPKGKLPYIVDEGKCIADSFFILKHLQAKYGNALDDHLTIEQKAGSHVIIKALEEHLYWCVLHSRWVKDDTWPTVKQAFFGNMPFPLKYVVPWVTRNNMRTACLKQGIGKHSDEEILAITKEMLASLSVLLGDKRYFYGEKPSTLDAVAFAFLAQITISKLNNPLNDMARTFHNLVTYCERIDRTYYADANS